MAYYTKYNNKWYNVNLNSADSTKYPTADSNGRPCKTSAYTTGIYQATGFYSGTTAIYTQLAYSITLQKNANITSISLTYIDIDGNSQTKTTADTYYAKPGTNYSWSATAASGYDVNKSGSNSSSGSGTVNTSFYISPTADIYYVLSTSKGVEATLSVTKNGTSLSNNSHIYNGDVLVATMELGSSYYGKNKISPSISLAGGGGSYSTTSSVYQTTNSTRDGWTTTTSTNSTGLLSKRVFSITVGTGNVSITAASPALVYTYHEHTSTCSSNWNKNGGTFSPMANTSVSNLNYWPTNAIQYAGRICLQKEGTNTSIDGTLLSGSKSVSLKYAGISGNATIQPESTVSSTAPKSFVSRLNVTKTAGAYKWKADVWGCFILE